MCSGLLLCSPETIEKEVIKRILSTGKYVVKVILIKLAKYSINVKKECISRPIC